MSNASFKLNDVEVFSENSQVITAKNVTLDDNTVQGKGIAKAWVVFNGQTDTGNQSIGTGDNALIHASYNCTSIAWIADGRYQFNIPSDVLTDTHVAVSGNASFLDSTNDGNSGVVAIRRYNPATFTTTSIPFQTTYYGTYGTLGNFKLASVIIFGS